MKNYTLLRFVKLNLYFFTVYSSITALWYTISGRFGTEAAANVRGLLLNAAIFSLLFSLLMLTWYRRTRLWLATTKTSYADLQKQLSAVGFEKVKQHKKTDVDVYKPTPPKAAAMAGKTFVRRTSNFYIVEGPARILKKL